MKPASLRQIPAGIWALGFVSMLADISSEIIHSLLPLFMVTVLGLSALSKPLFAVATTARIVDRVAREYAVLLVPRLTRLIGWACSSTWRWTLWTA